MIGRTAKRRVEAVLAQCWPPKRAGRVVILCYHSIHPIAAFASATPTLFAEHLAWLREHCHVVPLRQLANPATIEGEDKPLVAITFDDGLADNHEYALPLLEAHGASATFFVTTGLVAADPAVMRTFARLYAVAPDEVRGLAWTQVAELHQAGMEIGAHTHTHPILVGLPPGESIAEVQRSKQILEDQLQEPIRAFAYPFGKPRIHFTSETMAQVAGLDFEFAVTVQYRGVHRTDSPFGIPRFGVTGDSLRILAAKVHGQLDVIGFWQGRAPTRLARFTAEDVSPLVAQC